MGVPGVRNIAEEAAYRAGMVDARLVSLEQHRSSVNGTIKATGDALQSLAASVNDLRLTIKMLELTELTQRVRTLEDEARVGVGLVEFKRWLLGAAVSVVIAITGLVALVFHLSA